MISTLFAIDRPVYLYLIIKKTEVKIAILTFICLALYLVDVDRTSSEETKSESMLPPTVAQTYGPAGTIIMWHDTNDDGNPDYKATYIFKDGRLLLIDKVILPT